MSPFVLSSQSPYFYIPEPLKKTDTPKQEFRFATYNTHFARKPQRIAEAIGSHAYLSTCDVIAIQEIEAHEDEGRARVEVIARMCGFNFVYAPARVKERIGVRATHGLAILSKHPLEEIRVIELPRYNLGHRTHRRICLACKAVVGESFIRIYNVHLDTRISAEDRTIQLEPIVRDAARFSGDRIIVAGDINTIPSFNFQNGGLPIWKLGQRVVIDAFMRENGYAFHELDKHSNTFRWGLGSIRTVLDAVYVKNLALKETSIGYDIKTSDHFPLHATLGLK